MTQRNRVSLLIAWLGLTLAACAGSVAPARTFRYADIARRPEISQRMFEGPFILEFAAGDRLPVELMLTDGAFALDPPAPGLSLIAKRRCYVRVDERGFRTSLAAHGFDAKPATPGSFMIGFAKRSGGAVLSVRVQTPRRRSASDSDASGADAASRPSGAPP